MNSQSLRRIALRLFVFVLAAQLAGCGVMLHQYALSKSASFAETERAWPAPGPGEGRVVVYWPRVPGAGFGAGGFMSVELSVDGSKRVGLLDQTFVFAHLAAGPRVVEVIPSAAFRSKVRTTVNVEPGKTHWVRVEHAQFRNDEPKLVGEAEARAEIAEIRHGILQPMPYNRLPENAGRP